MIKAQFTKFADSDDIISISVAGHADFAEAGHDDILCASVSALVFATVNALEDYVGVPSGVTVEADGRIAFNIVPIDELTAIQAQTLANSLLMALQNLSEENEEYLQVRIKEEKIK